MAPNGLNYGLHGGLEIAGRNHRGILATLAHGSGGCGEEPLQTVVELWLERCVRVTDHGGPSVIVAENGEPQGVVAHHGQRGILLKNLERSGGGLVLARRRTRLQHREGSLGQVGLGALACLQGLGSQQDECENDKFLHD